jgi:CHAD domain-containing protein
LIKDLASARESLAAERSTGELRSAAPASSSFDGSTAVGEAALSEVRRLLTAWRTHEPGARLGVDPEELHQLRVTARRLDATLSLFKEHLPAALLRARRKAKSLLRTLGATRDLDVQLAGLAAYCQDLAEEERTVLEPLKERLSHERARAHTRMLRALDSEASRRWVHTLVGATESPATEAGTGPATLTVAAILPRRVRRRFRRLRKAVKQLRGNSSMEEYHKVRRRAKQLRYALESGVFTYGKPAEDMLKALRRLQDRLGTQQDAYMAHQHLTRLAADPACDLPPATLFLMGRLAAHHSKVTAEARATVARCWRKVRGRRWKALRNRLGEFEHRLPEAPRISPANEILAVSSPLAAEERPLSH